MVYGEKRGVLYSNLFDDLLHGVLKHFYFQFFLN